MSSFIRERREDGVSEKSKSSQSSDLPTKAEHAPTEAIDAITEAQDDPPDGGYAWVVCGALSGINCFTWGVAASYGVYISHYLATDYFPGASSFDFALIGGLEFGVAMVISPICTILTRELGRFNVMMVGVCLFAGGFIAASFAHQTWQLYLSQGVCVGLGLGSIFIPSIQVLPQWFLKRRSLAGGIASAGSGFGGLAFSLGTNAMIEQISLAWALRLTGILCFFGNVVCALLIKDRNAIVKPPQLGFATHLLRRYDCLLLLCWAFINLIGYMTLLYSLSNYGVQVAGLTQSQASLLTAILNLGTGFGRPAIGLISDRYGRIQVASIATLANAVGVFAIWIPATNYGVLIFYALVAGAVVGVYWMVSWLICKIPGQLADCGPDDRPTMRRSCRPS